MFSRCEGHRLAKAERAERRLGVWDTEIDNGVRGGLAAAVARVRQMDDGLRLH